MPGGVGARRPRSRCHGPGRASAAQSCSLDDELLGHVDEPPGEVARSRRSAGRCRPGPCGRPGVAMKYSSIDRPSRKFDLIGRGIMSPRGLATRPRMPAIWRICIMFPRAPEPHHHVDGVERVGLRGLLHRAGAGPRSVASVQISTSFWRRSPSVMMPRRNWFSTFSASLLVRVEDLLLLARAFDVVDRDGQARLGGEAEAQVLDAVERLGHDGLGVRVGQHVDDRAHVALAARRG